MLKNKYITDEQLIVIANFIKGNKVNQAALARTMRYSVQRINVIINSAFKEKKVRVSHSLADLILDTADQILRGKIAKIIFLKNHGERTIEKLEKEQENCGGALLSLKTCREYTNQA